MKKTVEEENKLKRFLKVGKNGYSQTNGITLIALVITVIVLIILAGVAISMLSGDNGILNQAARAKQETEENSALESIELEVLGAYNKNGNLDMDELSSNLSDNLGATTTNLGNDLIVDYGDYKFLVDSEGNVTMIDTSHVATANAPKLSDGMIPIKYDTSSGNWVICSETDPEWYSYTEEDKKWANIMLCDGTYDESTAIGTEVAEEDLGSMFVWIPRYAYTITSGYHSSSGSLDVVWLSGKTYTYVDSDGNIQSAKNGNEESVTTNNAGYYVAHPAFTNGNTYGTFDNGEWKSEITGIWVAKFQAGFATTNKDLSQQVEIPSSTTSSTAGSTVYYPIFKGRKFAYNYVTPSQCYDLSQSLDDSGNPCGLSTSANSHLMKSSEWGAVAYLSISKYGYSEGSSNKEKAKNNLSIVAYSNLSNSPVSNPNYSSNKIAAITGYSATSGKASENVMSYTDITDLTDSISGTNGTSYAWNLCEENTDSGNGTLSSATGNIYGIYDMGGCLADYTASYINATGVSNLTTYGGSFATGKSTYLATAYPYQIDTGLTYPSDNQDFTSAYLGFSKIFGDVIWEISSNIGTGNAWFGQALENDASTSEVFFPRGSYWYGSTSAGVCSLYVNLGAAIYNCGFHSVLVVE